ncbi:SCO1860 family LAETG-anchored protein [Streptomyces sp. NPDC002889]|uniref:SCO1860 family LAETG-anchored protein n=1 Tax=Streptomyces sp. NPDC002889 TaxID=3364669 RepID=UPI0036CA1066
MNSNTFRTPGRRVAASAAAAALAIGPVVVATPAHATGAEGRAGAVVLRAGLDVSLLDKSVDVPLKATLNEVHAPESAEKTALSVRVDGVDQDRPVQVLRADVATAKASADRQVAEAHSNLAHATLHVPGLPLLSLIEVEKVTSTAICEAGREPVATSNLLGKVTVLGKKVTLSTGGPTRVEAPGVGEVSLDLSRTQTTSRTAAATALALKVSVNPLTLNVAEVTGTVTLAEATCESPAVPAKAAEEKPATDPGDGVRAQSGEEPAKDNLAETGGSSATWYIAGGAALLLAAGGTAMVLSHVRSRG